jgi:hypothetical protein
MNRQGEVLVATAAEVLAELSHFRAVGSDDPVKTDLELTCLVCGAVVCDIEAGDGLEGLAQIVLDHEHTGRVG